jgi:Zn-dependent protease with chaperone function
MPDAVRYHRLRLVLAAAGLVLSIAYLLAALLTGAAHGLAGAAAAATPSAWGQVALVASVLGAAHAALTFPLGWTRGWWLPRRYGLLHQSLSGWVADRAKAALLAGVLGLLAVEVVYALLRTTTLWWLWAAAVFLVVNVALVFVFPVWVVPLFYRLTPLVDEGLSARLLALARRAGVPAVGVWIADQSRKSRTANAAVVGLGRTRRIVLFDTLTARFTPEEIESVLAHELGHHVHGDTRRGLAVQGALTLASFWVADALARAGAPAFGLTGAADPAGMPWLALVLLALSLVALPLGNGFSRFIEREADDFALATTGNPGAFIAAMERLAELNLAERRPSRLKELVLYSHPALDRRIARARGGLA